PRRRRVRSPPTPSPPPPVGETNYYRSKKRSRTRSVTLNQPALPLGSRKVLEDASRTRTDRPFSPAGRLCESRHPDDLPTSRARRPPRFAPSAAHDVRDSVLRDRPHAVVRVYLHLRSHRDGGVLRDVRARS